LSLEFLKLTGIYSMLIFLLILTLGFVYEWVKGALDW
jgi:NADH-quinone oxidoreductase subunit A